MSGIRTLVVEHRAASRDPLTELLRGEPDVQLIGACAGTREAVAAIRALKPDLVFIDVDAPEAAGAAIVDAIGAERMPPTIVVTAVHDGALRAFDLSAFDCLLRPFGRDRLKNALERARAHLHAVRERELGDRLVALAHDAAPAHEPPPQRLVVKSGGRVLFVSIADVDWIESDGNYVRLHAGGRTHIVRETMASLGERLEARRFARIHRRRIVNLDKLRELRARGNGEYDVVLGDGTRLRVGRAFRQALQHTLEKG
jgi:two-component system LytT family response regulator